MKPTLSWVFVLLFSSCLLAQKPFKIIAYTTHGTPLHMIPFDQVTHLNYSFAIPAKSGDTLNPLAEPSYIHELVQKAHREKVEVFLSVGGWGIGDEAGDDSRFHRLAERPEGRKKFISSMMQAVERFQFDGVDLDWEYPDPDHRSAEDFVLLMKDLGKALHEKNKKLTAAVVSQGKQAYGIKEEVYAHVDWLNIMVYDGDYGPEEIVHHSPYSMAVECLQFWLNDRKLPAEKCVLGLPLYAKQGHGRYGHSYAELLKKGASPYDDYWKGHFYNGTFTIERKTQLALNQKLAGVMVWEIRLDAPGPHSLLGTIHQTVYPKR